MFNKVILSGRIANDLEVRKTGTGSSVLNFRLAVEKMYKTEDKRADFINCVAWNKTANNIKKFCEKGTMIGIEGRLQTRDYDDEHGRKIYIVEVYVDVLHLFEKRKKQSEDEQQQEIQEEFMEASNNFDIQDDDIQF